MKTLYLMGTHHLDLKGPERLEKFLGFTKPNLLLVEGDETVARKRIAEHNQLLKNSKLINESLRHSYGEKANKIIQFLSIMHYEAWVADQHQKRYLGTKIFFYESMSEEDGLAAQKHGFGDKVDINGDATESFIEWIANLDFEDHTRKVENGYNNPSVQRLREQSPVPFERLNTQRDKNLERKIRELIGSVTNQMLYIGGVAHIFGDYHPNLAERLTDLNPHPLRLNDLDKF